jgi:hypothetical protein
MDTLDALVISFVVIAIGVALVFGAKRLGLDLGEPSKAGIILLPLVVFLIVSGAVSEFEVSKRVRNRRTPSRRACPARRRSAKPTRPSSGPAREWRPLSTGTAASTAS